MTFPACTACRDHVYRALIKLDARTGASVFREQVFQVSL